MANIGRYTQGHPQGNPLNKISEFDNYSCKRNAAAGFICGLLPFVGDIVSAIKRGKSVTNQVAHNVGHAYSHSACKKIKGPGDRALCALIVGSEELNSDINECLYGIASKTFSALKKLGKKKKNEHYDMTSVCRSIGELGFSQAVSAALDEATEGATVERLISFADTLQMALTAPGSAQSVVGEVEACKIFR